jgi:hypothetical protein
MVKLPMFDRKDLSIKPLSQRKHDIDISVVSNLDTTKEIKIDERIKKVAGYITTAKVNNSVNRFDGEWLHIMFGDEWGRNYT